MKRALITGITGQDGSYLAELLLDKGYEVHGVARRTSTMSSSRIHHLRDRLHLHQGDLLDQGALIRLLRDCQPAEIYNLGAQSFVPTSFTNPILTGEFTALGVTRLLEAIRLNDLLDKCRFYQASSSEMFGKARGPSQNEDTPFYPRSPYGVAKVYGHHITVNYRESYGIHASSGIMFNHECVSEKTPLVIKREGSIEVQAACDLVPLRRKGPSAQTFEIPELEVWDGQAWTRVLGITATRRRTTDPRHDMRFIQARAGVIAVTAHHQMVRAGGATCPAIEVQPGDTLALAHHLPEAPGWTSLTLELAELLGYLAADGYVSPDRNEVKFTNNDDRLRERVAKLWEQLFLGGSRQWLGTSGWNADQSVRYVVLTGAKAIPAWLREQLYNKDRSKRIPPIILNAEPELQEAFLQGYCEGDGLEAGRGMSVETNSPVLAQGLYWLYANQGRLSSVYLEQRSGASYYQLNIPSNNVPGDKGQHLKRAAEEVRRIDPVEVPDEWVFDLETESGVFMAGVGRVIVHNSPRRGLEFVTRRISSHVALIKHGIIQELRLGNIEAKRDWGYARDYVEAMWLMLQRDEARDYVIATGETHSVREFCEIAFDHVGLDWQDHVRFDQSRTRPAEVDYLKGDASLARRELGWAPKLDFRGLVQLMVDKDLERVARYGEAIIDSTLWYL